MYTNDVADKGSYQISYHVKLTNYSPFVTQSDAFTYTVIDVCEAATVTIPPQSEPVDYSYIGSTSFTASFTSSVSACSIVYSCDASGSVDWCTIGTFDPSTGDWSLSTSDRANHPPGSYSIRVSGSFFGYPSSE